MKTQVTSLRKRSEAVSETNGGWRALLPKSKVTLALIALLILLVVAWAITL
jgi:hypothetical protein